MYILKKICISYTEIYTIIFYAYYLYLSHYLSKGFFI